MLYTESNTANDSASPVTRTILRLNVIIASLSHTNSADRQTDRRTERQMTLLPSCLCLCRDVVQGELTGKPLENVWFSTVRNRNSQHGSWQLMYADECFSFFRSVYRSHAEMVTYSPPAVLSQRYHRCSRNFTSHLLRRRRCRFTLSFFATCFHAVILHPLMAGR